ncbi:Phosphoheptose isomerase [Poriferisphaera corsica]|uniref:Phosphoheptose isomerase n=1 Tax=Poriferisphaera corsica TaxID=2528020 RepID=A0A517YSS8_9BACT|nr:SIS domain-containing protein [Poriferisphaera corsica]QDU33287.1 Phosphoheptose isomerase [Poriferisphaera corsica]
MDKQIAESIAKSAEVILSLNEQRDTIQAICHEIVGALKNGNKILTAGHGGSAAEALHMSEELVGRFMGDRIPLPSICLVSDGPLLTCIANDYGFDALFPRQLQAHGKPGDVLVMFTTSGNGKNFVDSVNYANQNGIKTIAISGKTGGDIKDQTTHQLIVKSHETARVQEAHTLLMHIVLEAVERAFPPVN